MKLALMLALKQKPMVTALIDDKGGYSAEAVVHAINFARAHGYAQLLGSWIVDYTTHLVEMVENAKADVELMSLAPGEFEFTYKVVGGSARIDLRLAAEPKTGAGATSG